jgi:hypothetical protein
MKFFLSTILVFFVGLLQVHANGPSIGPAGPSLPAPTAKQVCERAGGAVETNGAASCAPVLNQDSTCRCHLPSGVAIDPTTEKCFDKVLAIFEAGPRPESPSCQTQQVRQQMAEGNFDCNNPISFCDQNRNPFYREYLESRYRRAQAADPEAQASVRDFWDKMASEGYRGTHSEEGCQQLAQESKAECEQTYKAARAGQITAETEQSVESLLARARAAGLRYARQRVDKCIQQNCAADTIADLRAAEKRVEEFTFNWKSESYGLPVVGRYGFDRVSSSHVCTVHIHPIDLQMSPNAILQVLTHELGHLLNPVTVQNSLSKATMRKDGTREIPAALDIAGDHPDMKIMECLHPFFPQADMSCLRESLSENELTNIENLKAINKFYPDYYGIVRGSSSSSTTKLVLTEGQCVAVPCPEGEKCGTPCAQDKSIESHADVISSELMNLVEGVGENELLESLSSSCEPMHLMGGQLPEGAAGRGTPYPSSSSRLKTYLSHPEIREKIGCDPRTNFAAAEPNLAPVTYCGDR